LAQAIALPLELRTLLANLTAAEVADDQKWILALLRQHGQAVVMLLWRMLNREQDVLDAYQTAVCQLTARGPDAAKTNPAGYFYRIAMNAGLSIVRSRKMQRQQWPTVVDTHMRRQTAQAPPAGEQVLDQREMLEQMRRAILQLPPHLRNVVLLRDLGEMPYLRVASVLGISLGTARLYRHQAVVRLAEAIGQEATQ
jgi:RNA polymerase sigma-70 factor, ECF subfamily